MIPVCRVIINGISLECLVLNPKNTRLRERGCKRGSFVQACRTGYNTYTGHQNTCVCLNLCMGMVDLVNKSSGVIPLSLGK